MSTSISKSVLVGMVVMLGGCASNPFADASAKTKQFGNQVSAALTPKPKTIPADDPVKLSSQHKPIPAAFYRQAAWAAEGQGNPAVAESQYQKALELEPQDVTTLVSYARFLDRLDRTDDALQVYQRAQSVGPTDATIWNDLGLFHARRNQWQPAVQALSQAATLQPNNTRYRNNLAAVLLQAQRPADAVRELEQTLPPAVARYNVGCILQQLRQYEAAREYFVQAAQLDPSMSEAQRMAAELSTAIATRSQPPVPAAGPGRLQQAQRLPAPDAATRY